MSVSKFFSVDLLPCIEISKETFVVSWKFAKAMKVSPLMVFIIAYDDYIKCYIASYYISDYVTIFN